MFKSIKIEEDNESSYNITSLNHLSKVNLFVGQNNSGKSRFIRKLFASDKLEFITDDVDLVKLNSELDLFYDKLSFFLESKNLTGFTYLASLTKNYSQINFITKTFSPEKDVYEELQKAFDRPTSNLIVSGQGETRSFPDLANLLAEEKKTLLPKLESILSRNYKYEYNKIFIPPLRGLRALVKKSSEDFYKNRTIKDHFLENNASLENQIYTGLTLFDDVKKLLLGRNTDRIKVAQFESFLSKRFFNNDEVVLIPNIEDDVLYIKIGKQEDLPIHELGDGIQSIIILTYPLFFRKEENLKVFIDEPELYLHPGMQRILLNAFTDAELFPNHQFFMSTHSNHMLDMTADFDQISIYTFSQDSESLGFEIKNVENGDSDVLNVLGVNKSSVFLSNSTLWVEGITDRIYLRKYLELYFNEIEDQRIKEDLHFSFVEYGGGNITHWSFLDDTDFEHPNINVDYLCSKLFLISDNDGAGIEKDDEQSLKKKQKFERHQKLQQKLGNRYYCLESREIENTLSPKVLKLTIAKFEKKVLLDENFKNWSQSKYKNELIGHFINSNFTERSRNYAAQSGTVNEKLKFAKRAVSSMKIYDDLTEEAKDLCEKIYHFILEQNGLSKIQ